MYQLEIVGSFISMFSLGIIVLISGFVWTRLEKKKDSKRTPDHFVKVCQNETCKKLTELMIKLMVTRLKFEDETQEISDVKEHLKIMKTQVHLNELDPLLARQEIFQCLRSTLGEFRVWGKMSCEETKNSLYLPLVVYFCIIVCSIDFIDFLK